WTASMNESLRYQKLIDSACKISPPVCAVAHPCDASSLHAAVEAARLGIFSPVLVGPRTRIHKVAQEEGLDISGLEVIDTPRGIESVDRSVKCVQNVHASLVMKGS